jgi:hypothetical protein
VEGFDPNDLFIAHMTLIDYSSYFTKSEQFKGGGDNLNIPVILANQAFNDMKELVNTNEGY